jgi:aspergillopepsin I
MSCRELLPLGLLGGLVTALLFSILRTYFANPHVYTSPLTRVPGADRNQLLTKLSFGNQSFDVLVDTGSSDTWLVSTGFTCFEHKKVHPQADCQFGHPYEIDGSFTEIPGEVLHSGYGGAQVATGIVGQVPVTLAGITVSSHVGVVNRLVQLSSPLSHITF